MSLVNIPRYCEDPNYRYKMPRIQCRIEGRGNGMKTNISNMGEIARALKRPPTYATKFFGCELGAMSKFEENEEKALINGAHNENVLTVILDKFIEMYVLCPECHLPEIEVLVKRGILSCRCNACGYKGCLDMTHKAASYMIKNPANMADLSKHENKVKSTKSKKTKKRGAEDAANINGSGGNLTNVNGNNNSSASTGEIAKLTVESEELSEIIERLSSWMQRQECLDPGDFSEELHMIQVSQDFDNVCRIYVAFSALFGDEFDQDLLKSKLQLVKASCGYSLQARDLLAAICYFVVYRYPKTLEVYPYICQVLYNADVVEGSDFVKFYSKTSRFSGSLQRAYMETKQACDPFIQWLQEDDGDDDESIEE